ncbi:peroxiredoxin [Pelagerythrobacter sp.]|uniref:peroxiredoxin n=1 Tax=Pelagerythrobacter sp. TaxID=2800702 RepID=UPI0035B206D7
MRHMVLTAALAAFLAAPAAAELPVGAKAPLFATQAAKGGETFAFNLRAALAKGPVVLYFYPKAFTEGCTLEARQFAEAADDFAAAGATVVGMSADDIATLKRFSTEECGSKFAVGAASLKIIEAYDASLVREGKATGLTERTSYVIDQQGRIAFVHSDLDYRDHVRLTLAEVRKLAAKR